MVAAVLGLGIIIGCICGLVVPSAAADDVFVITSAEKIGEIELGEYPQTYVGDATNNILLNAVTAGTLATTGKKYSVRLGATATNYDEYRYGNQRVVYLPAATLSVGHNKLDQEQDLQPYKFIRGETITQGQGYFFQVEPVTWVLYQCGTRVLAVLQNSLSPISFGTNPAWETSYLREHLNNVFWEQVGITDYLQSISHYVGNSRSDLVGDVVPDKVWLASSVEQQTIAPATALPTDFSRALGQIRYDNDDQQTILCLRSVNETYPNSIAYIYENTPRIGVASSTGKYYGFQAMFVLNDATAQYKTNTVVATCKDTGYSESWWEINGQQFNYQKYDETPVIDHSFGEWTTVTENTCVTDGELRRECTVCVYTETQSIPANDALHHYVVSEEVEATCGHEGYTEYQCTNCSATKRENIIPQLTHEWGEWVTTKEPTATTHGTAERTCSLCGATEQKTLPATAPVTGTTSKGGDNSSTVWLIFGIIAGGVLVLGGGAVSWLFIAGRQRKKQVATA